METNGKHPAFIPFGEITATLSFSVAPARLGELKKATKTATEVFNFEPCYNKDGEFIGLAVKKEMLNT